MASATLGSVTETRFSRCVVLMSSYLPTITRSGAGPPSGACALAADGPAGAAGWVCGAGAEGCAVCCPAVTASGLGAGGCTYCAAAPASVAVCPKLKVPAASSSASTLVRNTAFETRILFSPLKKQVVNNLGEPITLPLLELGHIPLVALDHLHHVHAGRGRRLGGRRYPSHPAARGLGIARRSTHPVQRRIAQHRQVFL